MAERQAAGHGTHTAANFFVRRPRHTVQWFPVPERHAFWAFNPPLDDQGLAARILRAIIPYDGVMPAPDPLKAVVRRLWWDTFVQEDTIRSVLQQVYIDR